MGKKPAGIGKSRKTLARNLMKIFAQRQLNSSRLARQIKKKSDKVSQRGIHAMLNMDYDPGLGAVERVAKSLGLNTWELLLDESDQWLWKLWVIHSSGPEKVRKDIESLIRKHEHRAVRKSPKDCDDGNCDEQEEELAEDLA